MKIFQLNPNELSKPKNLFQNYWNSKDSNYFIIILVSYTWWIYTLANYFLLDKYIYVISNSVLQFAVIRWLAKKCLLEKGVVI